LKIDKGDRVSVDRRGREQGLDDGKLRMDDGRQRTEVGERTRDD